ncbi:protein abrupt [Anopheles maculipalpis]|uniref:protein abrupt n=1 Tax=Anopheles maculipalpis TaxID=1496333 RepID=UPI002159AEA6|nr:protein abrupt [Anopheles maculipalpis]
MDAANTHPLGGRPGSCTGGAAGVGSGGGGRMPGGGGGGGGGPGSSSPQQFCLRWHNHQASLLSSLPLLLDQSHLTDVTLMAEGQKIKAHRVVLSACSTFFSELFRTLDGAQYPVVVLPGASYHAVAALITFMYSGEVNVYEAQISVLLSLAETLGIKGLADINNSNPNKSSTPSTEASSSRDSDVPSPYHSMKVSSPVDNFFARPYGFGSEVFEMRNNAQALNLITNSGGSNGGSNGSANAANNHNDGFSGNTSTAANNNTLVGKSLTSSDLYARFEADRNEQLSAEALCKMNELNLHAETALMKEKQHHLNRAITPIRGPTFAHQQQHQHSPHLTNPGDSRAIIDSAMYGNYGNDSSRDCKLPNGPLLLGMKLKEEDLSDSIHQLNQSYGSVPSTPTAQTPGQEDAAGRITQTSNTRKTLSAQDTATSKRKKLEQIAENLFETLKQSTEGAKLPLHLFNKPPTVTPVSTTQNPYLAHHFLTNESASKTPENFSLESSHPNAASNTNTRASPIATATSIGTASSPTTTPGSLLALTPSPGSANENLIKTLHITHPSQVVALQQQQHQQSPQQPSTQKPPSSKLYATCAICNKQLSNQYNLRVHLETHQNVRYACTVCSHVSRSKDALRKHVSYRHPGTPSPCDPDTKRKRSKGTSYSQLAKQDGLTEQQAAAILSHQQQQQHQQNQQQQQQQASNLLANLTGQGPLPSLLQTFAAHHKSAALLFNQTASVAAMAQSGASSSASTSAPAAPSALEPSSVKREVPSEVVESKSDSKSNDTKPDDPTTPATKQSDKDI